MVHPFEEIAPFHNEVEGEGKEMAEDRYTTYEITKRIVS
jgi:hypothetical protein